MKVSLQTASNEVVLFPFEGKRELTDKWEQIAREGKSIDEYHFIGHGGMYGPMYGSTAYPEQFSPFELKNLKIPFSENGKAYIHCCRSARWFAPFFARHQNVTTYGYHWYTAFTADKNKYKRVSNQSENVYAIGCPGKKSHGWIGSIKKHLLSGQLESLKEFPANTENVDATYNKVANLYDAVFRDIKVRKDEWNWFQQELPENAENKVVAEIGCGNGALLKELSPSIKLGIGLDLSENLLKRARILNQEKENLDFRQINGPELPLEDNSVDIFISMLSFRYLDWDPLMLELKRVMKPNGQILVVDMVTAPLKPKEYGKFIFDKIRQNIGKNTNKEFKQNLNKLVTHPDWKVMLKYNPIRSEHEMRWYLESRFPGRKVEIINMGYHSRMMAFNSGNIENMKDIKLTYP